MKYRKLDLELFEYEKTGDQESCRVHVSWPAGYEESIGANPPVQFDPEFRLRLKALENRSLKDESELIAVGRELGRMLFGDGTKLYKYLDDSGDDGIRIQIRTGSYVLANIPWEYAYLEQPKDTPLSGFLALNPRLSLVRYEIQATPLSTLNPLKDGTPKLAALMADPGPPKYETLKLADERQKMEDALLKLTRSAPGSTPKLATRFFPEVTLDDLEAAISEGMHVFHFAGHGEFTPKQGTAFKSIAGEGHIVIFGDDKQPLPFSVTALAQNLTGGGIRLAVLGACETGRRDGESAWSGIAPALARANIPAIVAMQYKIYDKNSIPFAYAFYRALAEHKPIDAAMWSGRMAIYNRTEKKERDWGVPVLYLRADEGAGVIFPPPGAPAIPQEANYQSTQAGRENTPALISYSGAPSQTAPARPATIGAKQCPNCMALNLPDAKFCMRCSKAFPDEAGE